MATYTDDFEGAVSDTQLESWTPSGTATGWTRDSGNAASLIVDTDGSVYCDNSTETHVSLDDKPAGANHYVQYKRSISFGFNYAVMRYDDNENWFGGHVVGDDTVDFYNRTTAGGFQFKLGPTYVSSAGDDIYLEGDGDDFEVFIAGVSRGTFTDSDLNTVADWSLRNSAFTGSTFRDIEFGDIGTVAAGPILASRARMLAALLAR